MRAMCASSPADMTDTFEPTLPIRQHGDQQPSDQFELMPLQHAA
jgi:hypothetical protein